ncbi:26S proteasome non-ATPase regulatory subunit 9-like isoform X2 [Acropora muricata]|uniref:26S proteasome non-ATPase regulatory subunit 9-like isoform X2 n=1 Tax=Acropora muricata TaxID=159855 RepID=UPI0034E55D7E
MADVSVKKVKELMAKKEAIEKEIKEFQDVLNSQKNVGMHEKLIDDENYPRSDIDVYTVRVARNRIICLQNDHQALMKEIEKGIHEIHAHAREKKENERQSEEDKTVEDIASKLKAFLRVDSVAEGSPSSQAVHRRTCDTYRFYSVQRQTILLVNEEPLGHEWVKVESKCDITLCNAYQNQCTSDNLQPWKCL